MGAAVVTIETADGGTLAITRCGALVDLHLRDSEGRSVATVTRLAGSTALLLSGLRSITGRTITAPPAQNIPQDRGAARGRSNRP